MDINNNQSSKKVQTAVLFLIFNRPETTKKVFEIIRKVKPKKLYVAADGPRDHKIGEEIKISEVREIATNIDWPCEVKTLFRDKNLGCKKAISQAINWFFDHEEQGIILEDDCLPNEDFFFYSENLLDRYKENENILAIAGTSFYNNHSSQQTSYYFSKYIPCWGWATWRRAWKNYNENISFWPEWRMSEDWLKHTPDKIERKYWKRIFDLVRDEKIDSWAYPWTASIWHNGGLVACPSINLVSNIGFGLESTHTHNKNNKISNMSVGEIGSLKHPSKIQRNVDADTWIFNNIYGGRNLRFPYNFIFFPIRVIRYFFKKIKKFI